MSIRISLDQDEIADFCQRWKIVKLSFFGSVLREDFGPNSDVDVLVTFVPDAHWSLFDMVHMHEELEEILGRDVDLVSRRAVEASRNYVRRKAILSSAECGSFYAHPILLWQPGPIR
jgi:predicted nucleotidyltransferase